MESGRKANSRYAFWIVAAGCAMCLGPIGIAIGCFGIFVVPVTTALHISMSVFSLYLTVMFLTMMVATPVFGRLITKIDARILLSAAVIIVGSATFCMGFFTAIWQWYVAGFFLGLGQSFFFYLGVPTLINRWFKTGVGLYTGLCFAFTGVGGVVFNPLGGWLMRTYSYHIAYNVFGILILVIALPFTLFVIRSFPADKGLEPYGADKAAQNGDTSAEVGVSAAVALRSPVFYALALYEALVGFSEGIYQYLPAYTSTLPLGVKVVSLAATVASVAAMGQLLGKVTLGSINDKNPSYGMIVGLVAGALGYAIMWFVPSAVPMLLIGGFMIGIKYAMALVQSPLMARAVFGSRDYPRIWGNMSMGTAFVSAFSSTGWGYLVDKTGGFHILWIGGLAITVVCWILGAYSLTAGRKLVDKFESSADAAVVLERA